MDPRPPKGQKRCSVKLRLSGKDCSHWLAETDEHEACSSHRTCHRDDPCGICKSWSAEKWEHFEWGSYKARKERRASKSSTRDSSTSGHRRSRVLPSSSDEDQRPAPRARPSQSARTSASLARSRRADSPGDVRGRRDLHEPYRFSSGSRTESSLPRPGWSFDDRRHIDADRWRTERTDRTERDRKGPRGTERDRSRPIRTEDDRWLPSGTEADRRLPNVTEATEATEAAAVIAVRLLAASDTAVNIGMTMVPAPSHHVTTLPGLGHTDPSAGTAPLQ